MTVARVKKIKNLIAKKGLNIKSLANKAGYSRVHVSNVVHGHFKSPTAREAIARALGAEPQKLFR